MQRFLAATEVLGDREVAVIAATRGVKRDQNDLVPSGISLENFRRNPIILWQHSPDQPIGCATAIGIVGDELRARIEFAPAGCSALADQLCSLVKAGIVRSISVGFDAKETQPIDPKRPRGGQLITRSELLELSFVSVPADPDAVVIERAVQGDIARFVSLQRIPAAALQRTLAKMPRRSDGAILSHAGHVFAILKAHEIDDEERYGLAGRQRELERLRQIGRQSSNKPDIRDAALAGPPAGDAREGGAGLLHHQPGPAENFEGEWCNDRA
jgi:HK97 family phage prohead protease